MAYENFLARTVGSVIFVAAMLANVNRYFDLWRPATSEAEALALMIASWALLRTT